MEKNLTLSEFAQLCRDADLLLETLLSKPSPLQGKQPKTLKAAAIWYLAKKRGLHVTMCNLHQIYGSTQPVLIKTRRLIETETAGRRHT